MSAMSDELEIPQSGLPFDRAILALTSGLCARWEHWRTTYRKGMYICIMGINRFIVIKQGLTSEPECLTVSDVVASDWYVFRPHAHPDFSGKIPLRDPSSPDTLI